MDITSLEWEADSKGNPKISVWAKCHTVEDVEDIIAWLHLAKDMMRKWEKIREKRGSPSGTRPGNKRSGAPVPDGEMDTAEQATGNTRVSNLVPDRNSSSGFRVA